VVEIASGMNYFDGQNWVPSDASFDVTPDAFVARRVQHKVRLEANLNRSGAVTVTTPDGIVLRFTPVGIGLYDAASGQSAIIAAIKDCSGALVSSNQVVYENAFNENGVQGDLVFRIEKGSFEQDVVFRSRLNVADYGFPANTTRIQILTEFYGAPQPDRIRRPIRVEPDEKVRTRMVSPDLVDEVLGFGELAFVTGRARGAETDFAGGESATPIVKTFTNVLGRAFMIESVEFKSITSKLASLPGNANKSASVRPRRAKKSFGYAAIPSPRSDEQAGAAPRRTSTQLARLDLRKRPGVVLDAYAEIGGPITGTKTFQGDTTYFVSAPVNCNGAVNLESAVFKFPNSTGNNPITAYLKINNSLTCKTSSYRPCIFSAGDDESIGESLSGGGGPAGPGARSTPTRNSKSTTPTLLCGFITITIPT